MKKQKFNISGMSCSACSAAVQRAMDKLNGVNSADVNLLTNSMTVVFDENTTSEDIIISTVRAAGYDANTEKKDSLVQKQESLDKNAHRIKIRLLLSIVFLMLLMILSMGHMVGINIFPHHMNLAKGIAEATLLLPILILNHKYFTSGFKALIRLNPNMDSLIAVGAATSVIYSVWQMTSGGSAHYYFESAGMILTFITIGKFLESKSKAKTTSAVRKLMDLTPRTSIVIRDGKEVEIDSKDIVKGDIIIVKSGTSFPADGYITEGSGQADESAVTGESMPVKKTIGARVTGGTILQSGYVKFTADKVGEETALAEIIRLVEDATVSKPKIARIADRISRIFVPSVIIIALLTTAVWMLATGDFELSLNFGISVLVISCPCALGLATPTAIMVGTGKAAELGILIKSAEIYERGSKIKTVMLDKTGTITQGKPVVTDVITDGVDPEFIMAVCAKIESMSEHPLAQAVAAYTTNTDNIAISNFNSYTGKGVSAEANGSLYHIGNKNFAGDNIISSAIKSKSEALSNMGKTVIFAKKDGTTVAVIGIADKVKDTSKEAISLLNNSDIQTVMLTGDNKITAEYIKADVNITDAFANLMPADKNRIITEYRQRHAVAMVGDGINDSPALASADVGIALGAGTDIAIEAADIVLLRNDLRDVYTALHICKKVMKNIKENLFWALIYNTICIPIAAGALYLPFGITLSPMIGTIAMSMSSVCVITNALRLKKIKQKYTAKNIAGNRKEKNKMKTINIEGMACPHCEARVTEILKPFDTQVVVDHKKGTAIVADDVDNDTVKDVIENAGYKVISIE